MFRNLKFKYKVITLPLLAVVALLLLLFVTQFFGQRNYTLFTQLEAGFAPALELGYDLEKTLTDIQRSMQDAVAAADEEEFEQTNVLAENFLQLLDKGDQNPFFKTENLQLLRFEFQQYYELARKTSQHLIEGKSLEEEIVSDLRVMSEQYNSLKEHVKAEANRAKERVALLFEMTLENNNKSAIAINIIIVCCTILLGGVSFFLIRSITTPLRNTIQAANQFTEGESHVRIPVSSTDEIGELGNTLNTMMEKIEKQDWFKTGQTTLNEYMRGEQEIMTLSRNIVSYLSKYLAVQIGAIYLHDDNEQVFKLAGSYAYTQRKGNRNTFKLGESLVGQAALEKERILFTDIPDDYIKINSGLGEVTPRNIFVIPFLYENTVKGVIELGSAHRFTENQMDFLSQACESIAIAIHSAQSRVKMQELLAETQRQSEALQSQQEELRQAYEELEKQTKSLQASEEKLRSQQEELRQTNEELEEQARLLEHQKQELGEKNRELEKAQELLEQKAKDLELTSKYKSEFLANMSHELRTPLNSLLILSKLLVENKDGNLTDKQMEFARTIHTAGSDLLELINEVLDLSKVEAGKMTLNIENMSLKGLSAYIEQHFSHVAKEKGLELTLRLADGLPPYIRTDRQRVEQILKNLLSNAVKFTEKGKVSVHIAHPADGVVLSREGLVPQKAVAIAVSDTGIGIPKEKQKLIFEAFQQADGTTNRRYGGTGLGLSISRELAKNLRGEIHLYSEEGNGSTFTLYLPEKIHAAESESQEESSPPLLAPSPSLPPSSSGIDAIRDDRHDTTSPTDKFLLIIEDDPKFAKILFDLAREKGFKGLIAGDGAAGLQLAYQYKPSAIILDIGLPGMDGWTVMEKLKQNPDTRHIPVHFISASDQALEAMKMGAVGYLTKPVTIDELHEAFKTLEASLTKTIKKLLVVEDDEATRNSILELLSGSDVDITTAETGEEAYNLLNSEEFDCMVLDLGLADISGFDILEKIKDDVMLSHLPIIVYTAKELTKDEEKRLKKYAESIVIKGAKSQERLLDEVTLFLHRVEADLPEAQRKKLRRIHNQEEVLNGKTILMVDDDMRNVFALSSVLEEKGMTVLISENGKEALELLNTHPNIDLVLMDIMMPEMNGYETMQEIRKQPKLSKLPIIALTAKAMKGDRQRCIDAGANDYLAKPVDTDKLLSLFRVWLY